MTEFEYWWLLAIPLFFLLGWMAARMDIDQLLSESSALPAAYFRGLNFLIREQHDKAIEAFTEAVQANTESLELHFALGNLFRLRGEINRAIHLHQGLLQRPQLTEFQHTAITAELAEDFLKAGMLDRAEELLHVLCASPSYLLSSLRSLLDIHVREREWNKAIVTAGKLQEASGTSLTREIAQFHCELAATALQRGDPGQATLELEAALRVNPLCARATLMQGEMEAAAGHPEQALALWESIVSQQPRALGLAAPQMLESYRATGREEEGLQQLHAWAGTYALGSVLNLVFQATLETHGAHRAAQLAHDELARKSSLNMLDRLLQARALESGDIPGELALIQSTVHHFLGNSRSYCCDQCGFRARRRYYWQCPGCNGWETFPPEHKEQPLP